MGNASFFSVTISNAMLSVRWQSCAIGGEQHGFYLRETNGDLCSGR